MNPAQREQIRSNAKYLRRVRPIDADEIHEYVDGRPHPAAVQQVLREEALDLGLVERDDGTFEPVDAGPMRPGFDGVDAFPADAARVLENLLVDEYGAGWPDGETGDAIRDRIGRLKADYLDGAPVEYDYETALAYAAYHLPGYYAAVQYVLDVLATDGRLGLDLRVLDVGAGVGGPALGLADFVPGDALVEYHAVEPSAAGDVLEATLAETGPNFHSRIHRTTAEDYDPGGEFDVLLFANVLSELDDPVAVVSRLADSLAPDGSIVALAPADRNTATGLRTVERRVEDGLTVYAPTVRLWPDATPSDEGWSFDVRPDLAVPPFQRRLADATPAVEDSDAFVNVDVQYAYSILRPDGRRRIEFSPDGDRWAKMARMEDHVTQRVDVAGVKLSHDLADGEDANPLCKIGDGSERVAHYAVLTKESALNRALLDADYGDVLLCENVLVLWNDDEGAYNLVVDGESTIDRIPASD